MNIHVKCSLITVAVMLFVMALAHWTLLTLFVSFVACFLAGVYGLAHVIIKENEENK